ncbi:MAG: hypothetical protein ACKVVP_25275 [Chloroflexota bacterium]
MLTPTQLYPLLERLLQSTRLLSHATARRPVARLLATLLVAQDLRPSALIRILSAPSARAARQRFGSVRRTLHRPGLTSGALCPFLIRAALAWVEQAGRAPAAGAPWLLALDSVRCGPWEVFTVGLVVAGRALPLAWAVLPYPWPRGRFRPTVDALGARLLRSWPPEIRACLLGDRAFPAKSFFRMLAAAGAEWTVRLQARHAVTLAADETCHRVGLLLDAADPYRVTIQPATFGAGADAVAGFLVIAGRELVVVPPHQRGPASLAARARKGARRLKHQEHKRAGTSQGVSRDEWLVLFTTSPDPLVALAQYGERWAIEGTYRDAQGGWDGQHGWHLDRVLPGCGTADEVDALTGFWALGVLVQIGLGLGLSASTTPVAVQHARFGWATTDRLSWWWRGRCALESPDPLIRQWIPRYLTMIATQLEQAPAAIIPFERPAAACTPKSNAA